MCEKLGIIRCSIRSVERNRVGKPPLMEKDDSTERDKTIEDGARRSTAAVWNRMN